MGNYTNILSLVVFTIIKSPDKYRAFHLVCEILLAACGTKGVLILLLLRTITFSAQAGRHLC